mgnify:CR=1 FL=1
MSPLVIVGGLGLAFLFLGGGKDDKGSGRTPAKPGPPTPPPSTKPTTPKQPPKPPPPVPNWSLCISDQSDLPPEEKAKIVNIMSAAQGITLPTQKDWLANYSIALATSSAIAKANGAHAVAVCLDVANDEVKGMMAAL